MSIYEKDPGQLSARKKIGESSFNIFKTNINPEILENIGLSSLFSDEMRNCLQIAHQKAIDNRKETVDTGDLVIGLLSLPRRIDSKLSRFFQEFIPVLHESNTFENPNQETQTRIFQKRINVAKAIHEFNESKDSSFGLTMTGLKFTNTARGLLFAAKAEMEQDNYSKELEPMHLFTTLVSDGGNVGGHVVRNMITRNGDFYYRLKAAKSDNERSVTLNAMFMKVH